MNRTLKYSLIGVGLTAATIVTISLLRRRRLRKELGIETPSSDGGSSNTTEPAANEDFPLKKGSKGERVKKLQDFLNRENNESLAVDGIFGSKTEAAVKRNQAPFSTFKQMHPNAVEGQVQQKFFRTFIG
tara:strand:+ start:21390 stop:21779 length:390 start_codon:yes stop_codon:yes gene_type:complete